MSNLLSRTPYGPMTIDALFSSTTLKGIGRRPSKWQVLEAFLRSTEGRADRVLEGSSGLVILVTIPGRPQSGAFYIYDEVNHYFFSVSFENQDNFHGSLFDYITSVYELQKFVEIPKLVLVSKTAVADKKDMARYKPHHGRHHHQQRGRARLMLVGSKATPNPQTVAHA